MKNYILFFLITGFSIACSTTQQTIQNDQTNARSDYTTETTISNENDNMGSEEGSEPIIHVVEMGESLWIIAQKYGLTVKNLVVANSIENPNLIKVGQELIIPKK